MPGGPAPLEAFGDRFALSSGLHHHGAVCLPRRGTNLRAILGGMEEAAPSRKRPWFQLHLSTCVVLMVIAGVLVWVNSIKRALGLYGGNDMTDLFGYGWPYQFHTFIEPDPAWAYSTIKSFDVGYFATDLLVALVFLTPAAIASEQIIRNGNVHPQKRPWFWLHPGTWLVLVVVAGTLVGLNSKVFWVRSIVPYVWERWEIIPEDVEARRLSDITFDGPGWPIHAFSDVTMTKLGSDYEHRISDYTWRQATLKNDEWVSIMLLNAICGLIALAFTALGFESFLRRLARKRAAREPAP